MEGISSRHGAHQVAQKLTNTTFPFNFERLQTFPSKSTVSKSGAGFPTLATGDSPQAVMNKTRQLAKINTAIFFIMTFNLL
jgi:hypothetical protein